MGNQFPDPQKGTAPQFSAHICCGQMTAWIKMSLGMELGLGQGDFVLDGDSVAFPQKGAELPSRILGPFLLWPNGSMHQDATWYGCWPQPRGLCVRWRPSLPSPTPLPIFGPFVLCPNGWMHQDATRYGGKPQPRRVCVRWDPAPRPLNGGGAPSPI